MQIIKRIPWKALLLFGTGIIIGFGIGIKYGHKITWSTTEKTLNAKTISEAVNKPTTSTTNHTAVNVEKPKKTNDFTIVLDSKNEQYAMTEDKKCSEESICLPIENLTRRQKKRLGLR